MEEMLRAVGLAIVSLIALILLRGSASGFTSFVRVGALILIFGTVVFELAEGIIAIEDTVSETVDGNSFVAVSLSVMIKSLGIAIIGRICADICKECGEGGLAQGVELVSGAVIFSLSLPILSEILGFASDVLSRGV